jgi:DtxR family transcriptional regulator, Mn-dependent transcriptional regulator
VAKVELSQAIQDYLKELYSLQAAGKRATTSELARRMGVSAPSATGMIKKLAELGLVEHTPYKGATLTEDGERTALEVVRHHRLLEQYLSQTLGLSLEEVHAEADRLEHALSEELEAHIDKTLGYPTHDPHGDPIPDANLEWPGGPGAQAGK